MRRRSDSCRRVGISRAPAFSIPSFFITFFLFSILCHFFVILLVVNIRAHDWQWQWFARLVAARCSPTQIRIIRQFTWKLPNFEHFVDDDCDSDKLTFLFAKQYCMPMPSTQPDGSPLLAKVSFWTHHVTKFALRTIQKKTQCDARQLTKLHIWLYCHAFFNFSHSKWPLRRCQAGLRDIGTNPKWNRRDRNVNVFFRSFHLAAPQAITVL